MGITGLECSFFIKKRSVIFCCLPICIYLISYLTRNVITYSIGIMIVLKLFYDLARIVNLKTHINQAIILFGQYSLVCYIMQIVFLQGMHRILPRQRWGFGYETISIFIITNIFIFVLCQLLRILRYRYNVIDRLYRLVFL
jgi:hypothetical protein